MMVAESEEIDKYVRKEIEPKDVIVKKNGAGDTPALHIAGMLGPYCMGYSKIGLDSTRHKIKNINCYPPGFFGWCEMCLAVHFTDGKRIDQQKSDWEELFEEAVDGVPVEP